MLDVMTQRGQVFLQHEQDLFLAIECATGAEIIGTPKASGAVLDGFVCRDGEIVASFEDKCRIMTLGDLGRFKHEWIMTEDKMLKCVEVSRALRVPFGGWLYLVPEGLALYVQIADAAGNITAKVRTDRTMTHKSVNSDEMVERQNAFICMKGARALRVRTNPGGSDN
jgi:hypothetical protein